MMANGIINKLVEDMAIYMLLKLPVKSLLRFKDVSKTFYTIIQSSTFINLQFNLITIAKDEFVLLKYSFKEDIIQYKTLLSFLYGDCNNRLHHICPDLDVPYMTSLYDISQDQLVGPSNGLIALMDNFTTVVLNPSTRNYRLLPLSPFNCAPGVHRHVRSIGFGYDRVVNDYKYVRISEFYEDDRDGYVQVVDEKVEVYELGIDCWRELDQLNQPLPRRFWLPCSQMFYKGAFHWIGREVILCFDMSTEIFRNMKMPNPYQFYNEPHYSLVIINEFLSMICYPSVVPVTDPVEDLMEIWIMKEYDVYESWIKTHTIRGLPIETPLAVWNNHLLLLQSTSGFLMCYDLNSDEVTEFNLYGCHNSMRLKLYKESLTLIPIGSNDSTLVQKF